MSHHPFDDWITEQELDEIPSFCRECGKVHGTEACQYDEDDDYDLNFTT